MKLKIPLMEENVFLVAHKIRNLEILKVLIHLKELKLEKILWVQMVTLLKIKMVIL